MIARLLAALFAIVLGALVWRSVLAPDLSDDEARRIVDWLTCDECTDGELDLVTRQDTRALPMLRDALLSDSIPFMAQAREAIAEAWTASPIPGADSALYVEYFAANLDAQVRKRSVVALAALGDTATLRLATDRAPALGFRSDVVEAIQEARRAAGARGLPSRAPARVLVRPSDVTVAVGDTVSLEALGRTADSARVSGTVTWTSADTATATTSSPGPGHGRVAGVSPGVTTITATLTDVATGISASGSAAVTVTAPLSLPPYVVTTFSGDAQVASAGSAPAQPLVVWVHVSGTGVSGVMVTWTLTGPGMAPASASSTTDAAGMATYQPTLGSTPGTYWVIARAGPLTARFRLRVAP